MIKLFTKTFIFIFTTILAQDVLWPTKTDKVFSSNFGENRDSHFHMGVDIKTGGKIGIEVLAVEDILVALDLIIQDMEKLYIKELLPVMKLYMLI